MWAYSPWCLEDFTGADADGVLYPFTAASYGCSRKLPYTDTQGACYSAAPVLLQLHVSPYILVVSCSSGSDVHLTESFFLVQSFQFARLISSLFHYKFGVFSPQSFNERSTVATLRFAKSV